MVYLIGVCIAYMFTVFGITLFRLVACDRRERLRRIKNFKRGNFIFIYIATIPLYFLAQRFNGASIDNAVWLSIRAGFEIVLLRFDYATAAPLMQESLLFRIAIETLFTFVVLNTLMFTASIFWQTVRNKLSVIFTRLSGKKLLVVVGANGHSLQILSSAPEGHKTILMGDLSDEFRDELYVRKVPYVKTRHPENFENKFKKLFGKPEKRKINVILNLEDDTQSLVFVKRLCTVIAEYRLSELPISDDTGLDVYVFASKDNKTIFSDYVDRSMGMVHFINRHAQIAMDFIDRYPLTQYMDRREIDYETATIRAETDLNVFMVGFGKLNESLFLASVSNNQFLTKEDGKLKPKPVTYHLFDRYYPQGKFTKEQSLYSNDLHYGYFRYATFLKEAAQNKDEYLEFPPAPAIVKPYPLDVSHPDFYSSFRPVLSNPDSYNYVIVSFGTDIENIQTAEKLQQKIAEWNVRSFVKIFVKVRDEALTREIGDKFDMIELFGSDASCVYNAKVILREKAYFMAKLRHLRYTAEDEARTARDRQSSLDDQTIRDAARRKWYHDFKQFQRESNVYACLSARMKLQLCGYDYAEDGTDLGEEFETLYENGDERIPSDVVVSGEKTWKYSNGEQFRDSLRWTLAVQEHQRWCANMIANGLIPCSKKELVALTKSEMIAKRLHANLTTMEGLVEFRNIKAKASGRSPEDTDVIRYDYQLMDDIVWLLKSCNYKIVKHDPKRPRQ